MSKKTVNPKPDPNPGSPQTSVKRLRMGQAGLKMYLDPSLSFKQALIGAGYSESTARAPKRNGLDAVQCLREAQSQGLVPESSNLVIKARRVLDRKLDHLLEADPAKIPAQAVARIIDITERYHGDNAQVRPENEARTLADRLELVRALADECARRGLSIDVTRASDVAETQPSPGLAEVNDDSSTQG